MSPDLFDWAWGHYRKPVEENWKPYLDGKATLDESIKRTLAALGGLSDDANWNIFRSD